MSIGDFVIPDYQRDFTWEPERRSKFIESLVMGLPIPFIFFWEMPDGRLEIVDGSQRLRTIKDFLENQLRLSELEQLSLISGYIFDDLPESRRRKIKNRSIRGIILNEHADEAARLDMFERINTGSKIANTAEVRRGALAGPFLNLVIELAKNARFAELAPMSEKLVKEREREELVTRFFAYGDGLSEYRDRPADFMFQYARHMNERLNEDPELSLIYIQRFEAVIDFVARVFPNGFRRTPNGKATPRARFEAIAIGSFLALNERPELGAISAAQFNVIEWLYAPKFGAVAGSDGANAKSRLEGRINFVESKLLEA